ncbi:hypothetical protein RB213_010021 [Colletotrichum asianum]|uniref:Uncharacterized protein n=1 Tax=Colletotrichum asianum TaxID=702518 RepID=A0A8H3W952_9PEZI|nr:hypothetical protein GQ607_008115 [Colletotrichum asianum]
MQINAYLVVLASLAITLAAELPSRIVQSAPNPVLAAREVCCTAPPGGGRCTCKANSRADCDKGIYI